MLNPSLVRTVLLASLPILTLQGCATPTFVLTSLGAADAFRPIKASKRDTCATQRQIAAHNSVYDTIRSGKEVVYKAHCA
jgi:hypothetical protein